MDLKIGVMDVFWDGGYMGNLVFWFLFCKDLFDDIVIVNINLIEWGEMLKILV